MLFGQLKVQYYLVNINYLLVKLNFHIFGMLFSISEIILQNSLRGISPRIT